MQRCDNDFQQMSENRGFNGGLIDLRVLRRGSQREKKSLQKKKKKKKKKKIKLDDNRKEVDVFTNWMKYWKIGFITRDKRTVQFLIGS